MRAVLVIPTYNERQNLSLLLPKIHSVITGSADTIEILIVDDHSPDGTADFVRQEQEKYPYLHLLEGKKEGLGKAYARGFRHALDRLNPDVVFMMDADLSHPAELIPQFLAKIREGADFVIGSRYIPGGDTPDWPLKRKAISRGANALAKTMCGLRGAHDCTSGYRAIRTSLLRRLPFDMQHARGYVFQIALLESAVKEDAVIAEVPLVFHDRAYGESKLSSKDVKEFVKYCVRSRVQRHQRLGTFMIVGALGAIVNLVIFMLMMWLLPQTPVSLLVASLIGDEISILHNFLWHNSWTFRDRNNHRNTGVRLLKFHAVSISSIIINNAVLFSLHGWFGVIEFVAKAIGIVVAFALNYALNIIWTWRKSHEATLEA